MNYEELSKDQLEKGLFVARHRLQLRTTSTLLLAALVGVMLLISANAYYKLLVNAGQLDKLMAAAWQSDQDWATVHRLNAPANIDFGDPIIFPLGNGRYDIVVEATNPNEKWALESFDFQFLSTNVGVASGSSYLMPGERKFVAILGLESNKLITSLDKVNQFNLKWRKVSQPFPDIWEFTQEPKYRARGVVSENGQTISIPASVSWSVVNKYTLSIQQVKWQVVLYGGGRPVSVIDYQGPDIAYGEEKNFQLAIFENLGRVDKVEVFPLINYFDQSQFYLPQVDSTFDDTRE